MPKEQYMCQLCANHGHYNQPKKGHKRNCPNRNCTCSLCSLNMKRRALDQIERQWRLKRQKKNHQGEMEEEEEEEGGMASSMEEAPCRRPPPSPEDGSFACGIIMAKIVQMEKVNAAALELAREGGGGRHRHAFHSIELLLAAAGQN